MDELEISGKRYISTRLAAKEHKYHADYIGQLIRAKKILGQKVGRSWYVEERSLAEYFGKEPALREMPIEVVAKAPEPESAPAPRAAEAAPAALVAPEPVASPFASDLIIAAAKILEAARVATTTATSEVAPAPEPTEVAEEKIPVHVRASDAEETEIESEPEAEPEIEVHSARDSIHIPIRLARPSFAIAKKPAGLRYIDDETPALPQMIKNASLRGKKIASTSVSHIDNEEVYITEFVPKEGSGILVPAFSIAVLGVVAFAVVALSSVLVNSNLLIQAGKTASAWYSLH